ncbi:MAG: stage II sporulation protein M [Pseudomonadota bacterium]
MTQQEFESRYAPTWDRLTAMLDALGERKAARAAELEQFPHVYRQVCGHLALARERGYSLALVERLNRLMLRGHQTLYSARGVRRSALLEFLATGFPARVRREWRLMLLSLLLFGGPLVGTWLAVQLNPELAYAVLEPSQAQKIEDMYRPDAPHLGRERGSASDFQMFGFYIFNNVRIAFQTFAGGLLFGLGTIFFLLFNGLYIGAVAGHLDAVGYGAQFYRFVVGHGSFELTAIVLAGGAGLKLGAALIRPGRRTRIESLRHAAREAVPLMYGIAAMLVIAAFIEAFWSSTTLLPAAAKYAVGAGLWAAVLGYLFFAGARRGD